MRERERESKNERVKQMKIASFQPTEIYIYKIYIYIYILFSLFYSSSKVDTRNHTARDIGNHRWRSSNLAQEGRKRTKRLERIRVVFLSVGKRETFFLLACDSANEYCVNSYYYQYYLSPKRKTATVLVFFFFLRYIESMLCIRIPVE